MEESPDILSRKSLRVFVPKVEPRSIDLDLTGDAILTAEQRRARDIALDGLATQRRQCPPDDEAIL